LIHLIYFAVNQKIIPCRVYKDSTVETSNNPVAMIPADVLKYFLPNKPSSTNISSGNKGMNNM
jgi:hypothetical protein